MSDTNKFVAKNGIILKPFDGIAQDAILKTNTQGHVVTGATFNDLSNTAHTHVTTDITNLSEFTDGRYLNLSGGTIYGDLTITSLSSVTQSIVSVTSAGTLYTQPVTDMYVTDVNIILNLTNTVNWNSSNVYVGPTITGVTTGQKYLNNEFTFEYISPNWFRNSGVITDLTSYATNTNLNAHTGDTTIHFTKSDILLDQLGDVNTAGTQQGYYLSYSGNSWFGVPDSTDLSNYYNKQQVYNTGETNTNFLSANTFDNQVVYNINTTGSVTALTYYGDGSNLTGLVASLSGLSDVTLNNLVSGNTIIFSANTWVNSTIDTYTTSQSDSKFVYKTGDTMTGALTTPSLITSAITLNTFSNTGGTTNIIYANSAGTLILGDPLTNMYIDDTYIISVLTNVSNWDINNAFIGTLPTGLTSGQKYLDDTYTYEYVIDTIYRNYSKTPSGDIFDSANYYTKTATNANFLSANTFSSQVNYNINTSGNITAVTYYGDGSNLTGIQSTTTDTYVSAFTYSNNKFTITQSGKSDLSVVLDSVTALTIQSHINFNTGSTVSASAGTLYFDETENALSYNPKTLNNDVTIKLGQETVIKIHNKTGFLIPNGSACHINGSNGLGHPIVELSNANSLNLTTGVATHDIANDSDGFITVRGIVRDLTITGVSNGTDIYLSDTIPGGFIYDVNALAITSRISKIGKVITTGITSAKILVNINNEFEDLSLTTKQQNIFAGDSMSTGVYEYLGAVKSGITINISSVKGWIVKNTNAHSTNPEVTYVIYSGATGVTITNLSTTDETYIFLNSASTIFQQNTVPTLQQRRENILLSKVAHPDRISIISINNIPDYVNSPMSALRDMFKPIKLINDGVKPTADGSNLTFNTTEGYLYGMGINFSTEELNPNEIYISAKTTAQFNYRTQTGGTAGYVTSIDPNNYDLNGNVVPVPSATTNAATNQRIYLFPGGNINIQYGQQVYDSLPLAIAGQKLEVFERYTNVKSTAILIGILAVRVGATDLSNTEYALFSESTYFGEVVSVVPTPEIYNKLSLSSGIITNTMDLLQTDPLDNTKLAVKNAFKVLFTNFYDVQNPTYKVYDVPVQTGISFNIETGVTHYVGLTLSGNTPTFIIKSKITDFNQATEVFMGDLFADQSNVYYMLNIPYIIQDGYSHFRSYIVNRENTSIISGGDIYPIGGTLKFARSGGTYWRFMANINDITNSSIITENGISNPTAYYVYNQSGKYEFLTGVDPTKYDVGGVTTTVPDNNWTITYVVHWATASGVSYDGYQRGDKLYGSLQELLGDLKMPDVIHPEIKILGIISDIIAIKKECLDLSDENTCKFIKVDDYGMYPSADLVLNNMQQTGVISWVGNDIITSATTTSINVSEFLLGVYDKENNIKYTYNVAAQTGISLTYLPTNVRTIIYYDVTNKTIIQSPNEQETINVIKIGTVQHINTISINLVLTTPTVYETDHLWQEYIKGIGAIKTTTSYDISTNTDLSINHTGAQFIKLGCGSDRSTINETYVTGATSPSIVRLYVNASGEYLSDGISTQLDATKYDDLNGVLKEVPTNNFVNLYLISSPYHGSETLFMVRGSKTYPTINEAKIAIDYLIDLSIFDGCHMVAKISIKKETTNLTEGLDRLDVYISKTDQFGAPIIDSSNDVIISAAQQPGVVSFSGTSLLSAASTTTFNMSSMQIVCMDYTIPTVPVKYLRNIAAISGNTITNLTTYAASWIGYDWVNSQIVQQVASFTPIQLETIIQLGKILHHAHLVIDYVKDLIQYFNTSRELTTELTSVGTRKLSGYLLSANGANLFVNHSQGDFQRIGCGVGIDINYTLCASQNSFSVTHILHSAVTNKAIFSATSTTIDVANYESSPGVLSDVAGNRYSNVFFIVFPWRTTQEFYVIRDKEVYTSLQLAESGGLTNGPVIPVDLTGGYCFAYISFKGGDITNLTADIAANNASITNVTGTLGGSNSATNQSLQSAYNSSITPEIVIDATRDGLTIKNGTGNADNITHLLEGMNGSNVVTSFISADGSSYFTSISATTISATTLKVDGYTFPAGIGTTNQAIISNGGSNLIWGSFLSANTSYYTQAQANANFLSVNTTLSYFSGVSLSTYNTYTGTTIPGLFSGYYTSSQTNANFLSANTFSSVINTNGINNTGNITASTYYGDGSNLTNITASAVATDSNTILGNGTTLDPLYVNPSLTITNLSASTIKIGSPTGNTTSRLVVYEPTGANNYIKICNSDTGSNVGDGLDIGITSTEKAVIWNYENTAMGLATNNLERLSISVDGNVGIGDTTPDAKLDVVGSILVNEMTLHTGGLNNSPMAHTFGNTCLGYLVANNLTTLGIGNTTVGYCVMRYSTGGTYNTVFGTLAAVNFADCDFNVAVGSYSLNTNTDGNKNTAIGTSSLRAISNTSSNIGLGYFAGRYAVGSNELYVDNQDRTNNANEKANAIIYGIMAASPATQTLRFNAKVVINNNYSLPTTSGETGQVLTSSGSTTYWSSVGGTGTITDGANLGSGYGVFAQSNGSNLEFKSLVEGTNITITSSSTSITISTTNADMSAYYTSSQTNDYFLSANTFSTTINTNGINNTGNVTATTYYGDGSNLTGIQSGVNLGLINAIASGNFLM